MTYAEKLKAPRWQRRRLEIMQRAGFKCEFCEDDKSTLHVHHLGYKGQPWDAPDDMLECLCELHHGRRHANDGDISLVVFGKGLTASQSKDLSEKLKLFVKAYRAEIEKGK